jgi:heme exporter protein C
VVAVFTLVGAINIPIIKFSVDWWSTLHQPASVFRADGPRMPPSILAPLMVMFAAFTFLFLTLHLKSMHTEIKRRRIATLQRKAAQDVAA